ncbi:MAG TPA: MFS transporter [Candidatus Eisenbacteria bacterium]|nr:MFS transporter [Candidatus Eisenbacteria bacterium]
MQGDNTSKGALKKSLLDGSDRAQPGAASFRAQVRPVFFLAGLFFLNFASRIILSPLLPTIEKELAISHSQAGFFFFLSSGGYLVGLLSSGVLTSRSSHRLAISASLAGVGIALLTIAAATSLWLIECGLMALGFAAGFYLPSAIATITSLVDKRHWGKAIAIHELAPNLAFFATPFLAEIFLHWSSWRMGLGLLGVLSLVGSLSFGRLGRGGDFPGESPGSNAFAVLARTPAFWLMMVLFGVGVSSTIGVYAMLPLYLVSQRNFDQSTANTLVAFSRSHGPMLGLLGGWASDKLGAKGTIIISLIFTGITTLLLGTLSGPALGAAVLVQPLVAVWFFPAAFAAIAMITPPSARNLAVAFSVPVGYIIGGGAIPTFIGIMGDAGSFATGFVVTGLLIAAGGLLSIRLRLPAPDARK